PPRGARASGEPSRAEAESGLVGYASGHLHKMVECRADVCERVGEEMAVGVEPPRLPRAARPRLAAPGRFARGSGTDARRPRSRARPRRAASPSPRDRARPLTRTCALTRALTWSLPRRVEPAQDGSHG